MFIFMHKNVVFPYMFHPPAGGSTVIWFGADLTVFQMCNLDSAYLTTHFGVEGVE